MDTHCCDAAAAGPIAAAGPQISSSECISGVSLAEEWCPDVGTSAHLVSLSLLDTYILQDTPVSCLPASPATHSIGQALLRPPVPRVLIADTCAALQLHLSNCL